MNAIVTICIKMLEVLFAIGIVGSLAVVAVSLVEDVEVIFEKDDSRRSIAA